MTMTMNVAAQTVELSLPEVRNGEFVDLVTINLSKERGRQMFRAMQESDNRDAYRQALMLNCDLGDFLKSGEYTIYFGKDIVVADTSSETLFVIHNNVIYPLPNNIFYGFSQKSIEAVFSDAIQVPAGVLLTKRPKGNDKMEKHFFYLLVNADEYNSEADNEYPEENLLEYGEDFPCISFTCLSRFYNASAKKVADRIAKGELDVVAFTPDDRKYLTDAQTQNLQTGKQPKRPGPGYTLVHGMWHRPSTVVVCDLVDSFTMLFGQDDDAYFGVELCKNARSVETAYDSLIPKVVKQAYEDNKVVVTRQGEWFAVSVPEDQVPDITECVLTFNTIGSDQDEENNISLNRDNPNSSLHMICTADGRVSKDGTVYAHEAMLQHSEADHPEMTTQGWVTYFRNTALRSFSVKGVD